MGTRADFYMGQGRRAEWLGSIAMDGYPAGLPARIVNASTEQHYRVLVEDLLRECSHATRPAQGWPWPWKDSRTTDYAYAWVDGRGVLASRFGHAWFLAREPEPDESPKTARFPDMTARQRVAYDGRSGLLILGIKPMAGR